MAGLQFEKCCCCCNLRIGCLVLGYLGLIGSIIILVMTGVSMVGYEVNNEIVKVPASIGVPNIIVYLVCLVFYAILLVGIYQRKPGYVNAAWIFMLVATILQTILALCMRQNQNAPGIIGVILGLCLSVYFALCVRSYYLVLKEEGFRPANQGGHA